MATTKKYHIVTYSFDCEEDDKQDCTTINKAIKLAKEYMQDKYYEWVKIYHDSEEVKCFWRIEEQIFEIG